MLTKKFRIIDRVFLLLLVLGFGAVYLWTENFVLTVFTCLGLAAGFLFVAAPLLVRRLGNRYGGH